MVLEYPPIEFLFPLQFAYYDIFKKKILPKMFPVAINQKQIVYSQGYKGTRTPGWEW